MACLFPLEVSVSNLAVVVVVPLLCCTCNYDPPLENNVHAFLATKLIFKQTKFAKKTDAQRFETLFPGLRVIDKLAL